MKVSVITAFTPTPENKGGISALIYHILKNRPDYINVKIYSFNLNNLNENEILCIEEFLAIKIQVIKQSRLFKFFIKYRWLQKLSLLLLKYPLWTYQDIPPTIISEIKSDAVDFIWIYPYFYFKLAHKLPNMKFIISGVDCISQVCLRRMCNEYFLLHNKRFIRNMFELQTSINAEKRFDRDNIIMHFVGRDDMKFYTYTHNKNNAFFLLHPHYEIKNKSISFTKDKLRILIAGKNDFYMKSDSDKLIKCLCKENDICKIASFTFLGKDWDVAVEKMKSKGFDCKHIKWVDNYIEEIIKYDIQISPIAVGSGTKGKVLDAFANGLLVIGSQCALENICVRHNDSCLLYKDVSDIIYYIRKINNNRKYYEEMAIKGRDQVRTYHSPSRISKRFFEISNNIK